MSSPLTPHPDRDRLTHSNYTDLVAHIQNGDPSAMTQMYQMFSTGIRFLLRRELGQDDLDDQVRDIFDIISKAICKGELREPERLIEYVHTVVRHQIATNTNQAVGFSRDRVQIEVQGAVAEVRTHPQRKGIARQNVGLAMCVLQGSAKCDREVLTRFYLDGESAEEVCRNMGLSETQFRLIKSRAKCRFGELAMRRRASRDAGSSLNRLKDILKRFPHPFSRCA